MTVLYYNFLREKCQPVLELIECLSHCVV